MFQQKTAEAAKSTSKWKWGCKFVSKPSLSKSNYKDTPSTGIRINLPLDFLNVPTGNDTPKLDISGINSPSFCFSFKN